MHLLRSAETESILGIPCKESVCSITTATLITENTSEPNQTTIATSSTSTEVAAAASNNRSTTALKASRGQISSFYKNKIKRIFKALLFCTCYLSYTLWPCHPSYTLWPPHLSYALWLLTELMLCDLGTYLIILSPLLFSVTQHTLCSSTSSLNIILTNS